MRRPSSARLCLPVLLLIGSLLLAACQSLAADGNRLAYLDAECDPYYVGRTFPKLVTPQWISEPGVEAVVVLAIDDMRDTARYERFLRPILDRLKHIDGRAAVSIMTCRVSPDDPQLAAWLDEGVSIECHTIDHPCPLLQGGDLAQAKATYDSCIDLMASIPGNSPVAFRVPCCDSQNTPSPRFWTEIFERRTPQGNFLQLDSSVFNITTSADVELPHTLIRDPDGGERFRKYLPFPSFVNTIEDYPYPYTIGRLCWEFPCIVPSDWEAQNLQQPNNPRTVADLQAALDAVVLKRGVFNLVFHPHGWIRNDQIVDLIDHAVQKHGRKVKFLTFREAVERINEHLLAGQPLRSADGTDNGVRLLDLDRDGYLDVVIANDNVRRTRRWMPDSGGWDDSGFPISLVTTSATDTVRLAQFGVVGSTDTGTTRPVLLTDDGMFGFDDDWQPAAPWNTGLRELVRSWRAASPQLTDLGVRLRDLDGDGTCEIIVANPDTQQIYAWRQTTNRWQPLPYTLPDRSLIVDRRGRDAGLRLVDVNADGWDDVVYSDARRYGVHLFHSIEEGWSDTVVQGRRDQPLGGPVLPMIVRADGTNNGAWFHSAHLWAQNEDTHRLPDNVDRLAFDRMLATPTQVGAARIDITPTPPIRLSGYGARRTEASEVAQRIWAKAIAIGDQRTGGPAILITVENCGMTPAIRNQVAQRLAEQAGLPSERLVISVTHTHAAPCLTDWAPFLFSSDIPADHQQRIDEYTSRLTGQLVQVALQALERRTDARLFWTQGSVDFAANRRVLRDGRWTGFGQQPEGPVDQRLPILVAKDTSGGLLAVVANYACHCTTLGGDFNQVSGDWAGFAQEFLEQDHPGAVAMITIGCGADANPSPRGELDLARRHGRSLADEVGRLLQGDLRPVHPQLECRLRTIALPLDTPRTRDEWATRAQEDGATGYHARQFLARLDQGAPIPTSLDYPVATWAFGNDLAMVFLAGEVVVDYSLRLHERLDSERLWISAYSNDVPCYIPSRRILREGGYEADSSMLYYARPTRLSPEVEDLIVDTVQKLVPPRFYSAELQRDFPPPKSPAEALRSMRVPPGAVIELVAAEPLIADPVAFDWGPDGRLWVAEMRDYPNGLGWHGEGDTPGKFGGRVKVLVDDDHDGRFDRATLFLDGLPFPTGIKVWRDGVLVSAAPEVFYAEDTDGDGRADQKTTLYEGFGEGNQQHRVNGLRWGLDHWLYLANGDSEGSIRSSKTGETVDIRGRDLRIRPDEGHLEAQSGRTQFGRARDAQGNWFGGSNSHPVWHYVLDDRYLRRNPHLAARQVYREISRQVGAAPVFPASRTLSRFNDFDRVDRFTSACSPMVFCDDQLSAIDGRQFVYVCEPVHNLVHREVLEPQGISFGSHRAEEETTSEFLASTDNWFRPVMVRTGPDGALWVADMYRFVIEHPTWVPQDWQRKLDVRAGDDRGRIYRVRFTAMPRRELPHFASLETRQLVAALDDPNGARRDMAQQLLFWRKDTEAVEPLRTLLADARWPAARLHALYLLDELGALDTPLLLDAIRQYGPDVRRHAIRLAEPRLDQQPTLGEALLEWAGKPNLDAPRDQRMKLQLAYSLGEWHDPRAAAALATLALEKADDPFFVTAAMSSVHDENLQTVLRRLLDASGAEPPVTVLTPLLQCAVAFRDHESLAIGLDVIANPASTGYAPWQLDALDDLLAAIDRARLTLQDASESDIRSALEAVVQRCRVLAVDNDRGAEPLRIAAIRILGHAIGEPAANRELLAGLLAPQIPLSVQEAAVQSLTAQNNPDVPRLLLDAWPSLSPRIRTQILDELLERRAWTGALLTALERGELPITILDARSRQQLRYHRNGTISRRAMVLLESPTDSNRQAVIDRYAAEVPETGDAVRGQQLFEKHCANCHRFQGAGHAVGPDLSAVADKSDAAMLVALLDPSRAVEDKFLDFVAVTTDGRQHTGMIISETSNSITLTAGEDKQQTLLRGDLDLLRSTGKSLMPDGLEQEVQPADMADLLAYVRSQRPQPKSFPGNSPQVAPVRDDGSIRLFAMHARIHGPSLVFQERHRNFGSWQSSEDFAAWTLDVPTASRYRVAIDYACEDASAGNRFELTIHGQSLGGVVSGTGGPDSFRTMTAGTVDLPAGPAELIIRADGAIEGTLMELRTILLFPTRN